MPKNKETTTAITANKPKVRLTPAEMMERRNNGTVVKKDFSLESFISLSENEHKRYVDNAPKIGHALLSQNGDKLTAKQFDIPHSRNSAIESAPSLRPLENIEEIFVYGSHHYRANTPGGTAMVSTRSVDFEKKEGPDGQVEELKLALFSPRGKKDPFWGSKEGQGPLFSEKLDAKLKKDLNKELTEIKPYTKGGQTLKVDHLSVPIRDEMVRVPDQNEVMGESARDAYEHFHDTYEDELDSDRATILKRAFEAQLNGKDRDYRPEWLHANGYGLTPLPQDPQTKDNLGAAPRWANTEMMILERVIKWYALNRPESELSITPFFKMLLDSQLIDKIDFRVDIKENEMYIALKQVIHPFKKYQIFRRASDIAQACLVSFSLTEKRKPILESDVKNGTKIINAHISQEAKAGPAITPSMNRTSAPTSTTTSTVADKAKVNVASDILSYPTRQPSTDAESSGQHGHKKKLDVSELEYSVVEISVNANVYDYDMPWRSHDQRSHTGSGAIIERNGIKYVLTNAHVGGNAHSIKVRLNGEHTQYTASVKVIDYQCDLALLNVDSPKFQKQAVPMTLGKMTKIFEDVYPAGFPMGGDEFCISKGVVTRLDYQQYCLDDVEFLIAQVDAVINPGNSGGPALNEYGEISGICVQGNARNQLWYIIPTTIVRHFLEDAFSNKVYKGFPELAIYTQNLGNKAARLSFGLKEDETGIRVKSIAPLSGANNILKVGDILLTIEGKNISNEGRVKVEGIGRIFYQHVIKEKKLGDTVQFNILRDGQRLSVTIPLKLKCNEDKLLGGIIRAKPPEYYVNSALVFRPITLNFLNSENGSDYQGLTCEGMHGDIAQWYKTGDERELVILEQILDCKETKGYQDFAWEGVIEKCNGVKVNNLKHLISLIALSEGPIIQVVTSRGEIISVPKLSPERNLEVCQKSGIQKPFCLNSTDNFVEEKSNDKYKKYNPGFDHKKQQNPKRKVIILSDDDSTSEDVKFKPKKFKKND